ncbi:putative transferase family protein [Phaeomoniella chlamydospora]|uniref:Putative transferase family protein n=1 Tax=Phaeomoniella chlamydospora TaxID=158046 RepID=A0A0G2GJ58_PHACM|nr:putative transferase family protein [Phaeomoniella chlamydospora]
MSAQSKPFDIHIISSERIFPNNRSLTPSTVALSIVDAAVANYSPTGAIWFFDHVPGGHCDYSRHLRASLQTVLDNYQQWTGELHWSNYEPDSNDHTKRFQRLCLTWGTKSDPGTEFVTASVSETLASIVPHWRYRSRSLKAWDHTNVRLDGLLPRATLALRHLKITPNAPALAVQVTTFSCQGIAIGIQMSHPLGDAMTLATFVRDWTAISKAMLATEPLPIMTRDFDPQQIDRSAAGDIDGHAPDPDLMNISRNLPYLRYDHWSKPSQTSWPDLITADDLASHNAKYPYSPGTPVPWSQWDLSCPCAAYILHFSGDEIQEIWEAAQGNSSSTSPTVSRHDALLAHLWQLINRSRLLRNPSTPVHLLPSLGLRTRLSPPLPATFLGSPILMTDITLPATAVCTSPLSTIAQTISSVQRQFTADTIPALLHDMIYADCPQRIWMGCLGTEYTMATSWVHLGVYEMDFGLGMGRPRYVEAVLIALDGLVQIMELGDDDPHDQQVTPEDNGVLIPEPKKTKNKKHWSHEGVDVSLALAKQAMERLLKDPLLRAYEK